MLQVRLHCEMVMEPPRTFPLRHFAERLAGAGSLGTEPSAGPGDVLAGFGSPLGDTGSESLRRPSAAVAMGDQRSVRSLDTTVSESPQRRGAAGTSTDSAWLGGGSGTDLQAVAPGLPGLRASVSPGGGTAPATPGTPRSRSGSRGAGGSVRSQSVPAGTSSSDVEEPSPGLEGDAGDENFPANVARSRFGNVPTGSPKLADSPKSSQSPTASGRRGAGGVLEGSLGDDRSGAVLRSETEGGGGLGAAGLGAAAGRESVVGDQCGTEKGVLSLAGVQWVALAAFSALLIAAPRGLLWWVAKCLYCIARVVLPQNKTCICNFFAFPFIYLRACSSAFFEEIQIAPVFRATWAQGSLFQDRIDCGKS